MRHGNYLSHFYGEWMIIFFIGASLAVFVGIIWLIHHRMMASDGLIPVKCKKLSSLECEILLVLRQNGGFAKQNEIFDELPCDLDDLAEVVKVMEKKGLLHQKWDFEQGAYIVSIQV